MTGNQPQPCGALSRHLAFPDLLNARDLGGCALRDGRQTRWRSLLRSDDLSRLSPAGLEALVGYGVRTVIDLRWTDESDARPSPFERSPDRVSYVRIPLLGESLEAWRSRRPAVAWEMWNSIVLDHCQAELLQVARTILAAPDGGVLFHCHSGKDRTGIIAALLLALVDAEPEVIVHDYRLSSDNLRDAYIAAYPVEEREAALLRVRCPPEQVHNMLAHLDARYGGPAGYLGAIGLGVSEVNDLAERLRPAAEGRM